MTADAGFRRRSRDDHSLRHRSVAVASRAVERRTRRIRDARVSRVIEFEIARRPARIRPRDGIHILSIVAFGASRRGREHRDRIAGADSRVASCTRRKKRLMLGVRKPDVVCAARCASVGESRGRRERDDQHEPDVAWTRSPRHGFIPGSRPTSQNKRTSARRWLQFTVVDGVLPSICRYSPACADSRTSDISCNPPSTDAPAT